MTKIDFAKLADTEIKNERFAKANKARKRVMIARDVLSQLGSRLIAKHRVWTLDKRIAAAKAELSKPVMPRYPAEGRSDRALSVTNGMIRGRE